MIWVSSLPAVAGFAKKTLHASNKLIGHVHVVSLRIAWLVVVVAAWRLVFEVRVNYSIVWLCIIVVSSPCLIWSLGIVSHLIIGRLVGPLISLRIGALLSPLVVALDYSLQNWIELIHIIWLLLVHSTLSAPLVSSLVSKLCGRWLVPSVILVSPAGLRLSAPLVVLLWRHSPSIILVSSPLVILLLPLVIGLRVSPRVLSLVNVIALCAAAAADSEHNFACSFPVEVELHDICIVLFLLSC